MKIVKATSKDIPEISRIFMEEFNKNPYNECWDKDTSKEKIKRYFKKSLVLVAEEKNLVGFLIGSTDNWGKTEWGYIDEICVDSKHQGKGTGKMLVDAFTKILEKKGIHKIWLMTNAKSNAYKFYDKIGFKLDKKYILMERKI